MQDGASSEATAERLRHALELFDDALDMLRLSIRRRHPDISELERRVDIWLTESGGGRSSVTLPSVLAPSHVRHVTSTSQFSGASEWRLSPTSS